MAATFDDTDPARVGAGQGGAITMRRSISRIEFAAIVALTVLGPCASVRGQSFEGDLATARERAQAGDLDGARARYETILNARDASGLDPARTVTVLEELAAVDYQLADLARAAELLDRATGLRRQGRVGDDAALGECLSNLAQVRLQMGRPDLARAAGIESLAIARKAGGVAVAHRLLGLAAAHAACHEAPQELRAYREALDILDRCPAGERPAALLAVCLRGLARAYISRRNYSAAEGMLRRDLDLESSQGGAWNPDLPACLEAIGVVADLEGHAGPALEALERALAMLRAHWGQEDPHLLGCLVERITVLQRAGATRRALEGARTIYRIVCKTQGKQSMDVAAVLMMAARQHMLEAQYADAERLCARAVAIVREHTGSQSVQVAAGLGRLATVLRFEGRLKESEALYKQSLQMFMATVGLANSDARHILAGYARLLRATGRGAQASRIESRARAASLPLRRTGLHSARTTATPPQAGRPGAATRG